MFAICSDVRPGYGGGASSGGYGGGGAGGGYGMMSLTYSSSVTDRLSGGGRGYSAGGGQGGYNQGGYGGGGQQGW